MIPCIITMRESTDRSCAPLPLAFAVRRRRSPSRCLASRPEHMVSQAKLARLHQPHFPQFRSHSRPAICPRSIPSIPLPVLTAYATIRIVSPLTKTFSEATAFSLSSSGKVYTAADVSSVRAAHRLQGQVTR